jgi:hypothetical protein
MPQRLVTPSPRFLQSLYKDWITGGRDGPLGKMFRGIVLSVFSQALFVLRGSALILLEPCGSSSKLDRLEAYFL